ncbi:MAG: hypothetical protein ACRDI2_19180, partial [Chloroflexota bacterium]
LPLLAAVVAGAMAGLGVRMVMPAQLSDTPTPAGSASGDFPNTVAPTRVATAMLDEATPRPEQVQTLEGTLSEYSIDLPQFTATVGTVRFAVTNIGTARHNLRVLGNGVDQQTPALRMGQSGQVDVTFSEPGPYTVYCDVGDHAELGMTATFTVE